MQDRLQIDDDEWKTEIGQMSAINHIYSTPGHITINEPAGQQKVIIDGTLEIKGRDVLKELDEMRDVMLLLKRDVDMEAKYPKLKELKDEYEAALAKYTTFDTLKESK